MIDRVKFSETLTDDFYHLSGRGEYCYLSVSHLFTSQSKSIKEFYKLDKVSDGVLSNGSLTLIEGGEGTYLVATTDPNNIYAIDDYVDTSNELLEYRRATLMTNANRDTPKRVTKSRSINQVVPRDLSEDTFKSDGNLMFQYEIKRKYVVTVVVNNALKYIQDNLKMTHTDVMKVNFAKMRNILSVAIKNGDMLINCTCPDFVYRFAAKATKQGYKYGNPETRPAKITNPHDRGSLCKHCLAVLYNNIWLYKMIPQLIRLIRTMPELFYSDDQEIDDQNDTTTTTTLSPDDQSSNTDDNEESEEQPDEN